MASKGRSLGEFVSAAGVSTVFSQFNAENGPVLIGSANSTGTSSQALQVTGGSYFSSNIGIGTTNPLSQVQIFNTSHRYITLTGNGGSTRIMLGNRDSGGSSGPSVIDAGNRNISFGVGDSFDTGDGGNITRYLFIENGGNIGIGTDNPGNKLEVHGVDASATVHYYGNARGGISALSNQRLVLATTSNADDILFGYGDPPVTSANFVPRMKIDNGNGNIGIGTDNPASTLDVRSNDTRFKLTSNGSGQTVGMTLKGGASDGFTYNFIESISDVDSQNWYIGGDGTANTFVVKTGGSEKLRITSGGIVQVGASHSTGSYGWDPIFKVAVEEVGDASAIHFGESVNGSANPAINFLRRDGNTLWSAYAGQISYEVNKFQFKTAPNTAPGSHSYTTRMTILQGGDVGIGTDNPGAQLEVRDSASQGIIVRSNSTQVTDTNKALRVRNNSDTNTFSVSHKGQGYFGNGVGINTDNVGEGLHVRAFDGNVVPLRLRSGLDSSDNTQLRFYGAYTKTDLWSVGNLIDNGGTGRRFEIFDNVANATRFEITDNSSIAMFNNGNGAVGASGADDGNVLHIQGASACLRLGPYYAGNDRDMILMRANGTDTYIRSNNERFNFYNNQGEMRFYTGTSQTDNLRLTIQSGGTVVVAGALSKGSGSFKIDHPLPGLSTSHHLVHSFVEGPRADLIYRGEVKLVSGIATIIMDEAVGITTGTWEILCRDPDVFVTNNEDWTPVKAGITSTGVLTIQAQDPTCTAKVNWLVIAERQDPHMYETDWTDENGRPILEPVKPEEVGIGTTSVGIGTTSVGIGTTQ